MADLWERLRAAKVRNETQERNSKTAIEPDNTVDAAPPGWSWVAPLVAERTVTFELEAGFWGHFQSHLSPSDWYGVLCFDTETTGLSGGAGTVAFLVGWASLVPTSNPECPVVEVRQWFLRDLSGEADMVALVEQALLGADELVSFNGASFDLPLLRSRWALNGRSFPNIPHRDDLHAARRLWKRLLESCRLSRLEETVLGIQRIDDVPGSLVPVLWFDYLRSGAAPDFLTPLEGVLRHHAQDVYSLLCLDLVLASLRKEPANLRWKETFGPFPHRKHLARPTLEGLLHPDLGRETPVDFWGLLDLQKAETRVDRLEQAWLQKQTEPLGLAWADHLKRLKSPQAVEIWTQLWTQNRSFPALEELLKWLEHREKGPEAHRHALEYLSDAFQSPFLPQAWKTSLEKRKKRLQEKNPPSHPSWA